MRFESFRDGMEDLELLYLLQQHYPEKPLLEVRIINGTDNYSDSINQHIGFRKELYAEINKPQ